MKTTLALAVIFAFLVSMVVAQDGCAEDCYSDTSVASCSTSGSWSCLCDDENYVDYVNTCIMSVCNSTDDRLGAYYTFYEICKIFGVTMAGEEASAASVASTSSISGLPSDIASVSVYTSDILKAPGKTVVESTSATSDTTTAASETTAASTMSTMNPGGPIQSTSSGSSSSSGTAQSAVSTSESTQPGGPVASASSSSTSASTQPGGPVESTSSGTSSSASATSTTSSASATSTSASAALAAPTIRPGHGVVLFGVAICAVVAI